MEVNHGFVVKAFKLDRCGGLKTFWKLPNAARAKA